MKKLYKSVPAVATAAVILTCSACSGIPAADPAEEPATEKALPETTRQRRLPYLPRYLSLPIRISRITWRLSEITVPM